MIKQQKLRASVHKDLQKRKGRKKKKNPKKTSWSGFFEGDSLLAVSLPSLSVRHDRSAGVIRLTWRAIILPVFCSGKAFLNMHALHFPTTFPIQMDIPLLSPPFSCRLLCHPACRLPPLSTTALFICGWPNFQVWSILAVLQAHCIGGRQTDRQTQKATATSWQGCLSCAH